MTSLRFLQIRFFKPKKLIEVVQWDYALKHKIAVQWYSASITLAMVVSKYLWEKLS